MRVQAWGWQRATLFYTHAEWMCSAASGSAQLVCRVGRCSTGCRRRLHSLLLLASSLPGDHARPSGLLGWRGSPPNTWRASRVVLHLTGTLHWNPPLWPPSPRRRRTDTRDKGDKIQRGEEAVPAEAASRETTRASRNKLVQFGI